MTSINGYNTGVSRKFGVTSFTLKIIAIVAMTMNHSAYIFFDALPFPLMCVLFGAGGFTFPIMAFLMVTGYRHTSNIKKYALRLAVFALISQIPFSLFLVAEGNVLFTLLISLGILYADDHLKNRVAFWGLFAIAALGSLFCDWGFIGVIMVYLFKVLHGQRGSIVIPAGIAALAFGIPALLRFITEVMMSGDWFYLPEVLYSLGAGTLVIPLLACHNNKRGRPLKWFFYAYYPAHIAILGLLYVVLFGHLPAIA